MNTLPAQRLDDHAPPSETCAVLLAAGRGSRFIGSSHKLMTHLHGRALYTWALDSIEASGFAHVVVVTGCVELGLPQWVVRAHNPHWDEGQASSLQCGIAAADSLGATAVVVGLADQPFVTAQAWRAVAMAAAPIAVATYGGARGNPVRLERSIWSLLATEGDHGARSLINQRPDLVGEVACTGSSVDIDTMEELQQWNSSMNSP